MLTQQALEQYEAQDPYWSADLMVALENIRPGMTLDWVAECAKALVDNVAPPESKAHLLNSLDELAQSRSTTDCPRLMEKSDRIWHEERDFVHTAIAHLYVALAHLLQNKSVQYRTSVIRAANVMGLHEFYRQTSLAIPLSLFERFMTGTNART